MAYVIPLVCFLVALIYGAVAMRRALHWPVGLGALLLAAIMGWAIWKGRQVSGWDGIGYGIVALLMAAPALLGLGAGALIGWWRRRRAGRRAGQGR